MNSRLPKLLSVPSILACVVIAVVWTRSHFTEDRLRRGAGQNHLYTVASYRGILLFERDDLERDSVIARMYPRITYESETVTPELGYSEFGDSLDAVHWRKAGVLGLCCERQAFSEGAQSAFSLPFWILAVGAAVIPCSRLLQFLRGWLVRPTDEGRGFGVS